MNDILFDMCGLAKCPNIHCVCVLTFTDMVFIFIMDVVAWEILKFMFRKEIKEMRTFLDRKLNKSPLVK